MIASSQSTRRYGETEVPAVGTWEFDPSHTTVEFEGRHLMVSRIRGSFRRFAGRIQIAEAPERSDVELTVEAASVESGFDDRDRHLRSADWLDVERYPLIRFAGRGARHVEGRRWQGEGMLTIKNVERPIDVEIEFEGGVDDPWGGQRIGAVVRARLSLKAFGLTWNMPLKAGGLVVGDEVTLTITVEAARAQSG